MSEYPQNLSLIELESFLTLLMVVCKEMDASHSWGCNGAVRLNLIKTRKVPPLCFV